MFRRSGYNGRFRGTNFKFKEFKVYLNNKSFYSRPGLTRKSLKTPYLIDFRPFKSPLKLLCLVSLIIYCALLISRLGLF